MNHRSFGILPLIAVIVTHGTAAQTPVIDSADVEASLERSLPYLQQEGRKWYEGETPYQKNDGCVSCHQVPSGLWSMASANAALDQLGDAAFEELLSEATDFVADPELSAAAAVSQLLLAQAAYQSHSPKRTAEVRELLMPLVMESQKADGSWSASGQFPSQQRAVEESDSVVTMWVIHALKAFDDGSLTIQSSLQRAQQFVESKQGVSSEWIAWRLILSDQPDASRHFRDQLISHQNEDGSWGFTDEASGQPYSTGVAIFALLQHSEEKTSATLRGIQFLLTNQSEDGSWQMRGDQISKKESRSRDYVYGYWGTAWAGMGLAQYIASQHD